MPLDADLAGAPADAQTQLIDFDGSEVAAVRWDGADLLVRLSTAFIHHASPREGAEPGRGFSQPVELRLLQAVTTSSLGALLGRLGSGMLTGAGRATARLAVPWQCESPVTLDLQFANGETLQAHGQGLLARAVCPVRCFDDHRC